MSSKVEFFNLKKVNSIIKKDLNIAYKRVVNSGYFILGEELELFEQEFAQYCGVKFCLGVSNGMDALSLLLKSNNIGYGDEVIVPSNTFIATWLSVSAVGAKPVPVEPDIFSYNINPSEIERMITKKTKSIIPVHLYGQCAQMYQIKEIAKRNNLKVFEDAAQAHGAMYNRKKAGSFSDGASFSFYPTKNLGALGDAGAITMSSASSYNRILKLRNYGSKNKSKHDFLGSNNRLDEMQAAFLRVKLKHLDAFNKSKQYIAKRYSQEIKNSLIKIPCVDKKMTHVWHQYIIQTEQRDKLSDFLKTQKIETMIHYPIPPHMQKCYKKSYLRLPITELLSKRILSLPIEPFMSDRKISTVIKAINGFN